MEQEVELKIDKKYKWIADHALIALFLMITVLFGFGQKEKDDIVSGEYIGVFTLLDKKSPFRFEVIKSDNETPSFVLLNAEDRLELGETFVRNDSLVIPIDIYETYLIGKYRNGIISGYLKREGNSGIGIPFTASKVSDKGKSGKITSLNVQLLPEKWESLITRPDASINQTVTIIRQNGNKLTGTILTITGDYRFLEGEFDGEKVTLHSFNGSSPFYLEAELHSDGSLKGELVQVGGKSNFIAYPNLSASLEDPYLLTSITDPSTKPSFVFPDIDGNEVSLEDERFNGKVVVLTITGSWCPNCLDESAFLAPWYIENKDRGVEVVALSFERKDDFDYAKEKLTRYVNRLNITYPVLFAGKADKKEASQKLSFISEVISFPTTIFIDKSKNIRKIHTGFSGPGTGNHYEEFVREFNAIIDQLISE